MDNAVTEASAASAPVETTSVAPTPDVTAPPSSASDVPSPSSSTPETAPAASTPTTETPAAPETKASLLDVIQDVLEPPKDKADQPKTDATPAADATADVTGTDPKKDEAPVDPTAIPPEELKTFSPGAQKRIRDLIAENKRLASEHTAASQEAQQFRQVQTFMADNNLSSEHVNLLLGFGATLRSGNLAAARDIIKPYYEAIVEALGEQLPEDLQAKVNDGVLPPEEAAELSRLRYQASTARANAAEMQQAQQAQQLNAHRQMIDTAARQWEAHKKATDPDYEKKQAAIWDRSRVLVMERGIPATPEQAVKLAEEAYTYVNNMVQAFRPVPQPTRPAPASGTPATSAAQVPPKDFKSAILRALG